MSREPQETYPKSYKPPIAPNLTPDEARCVASLVAFRRAFHNSPLYTHRHITSEMMTTAAASAGTSTTTTLSDPVPRMYGQAQVNARYGVKNRATLDPFLAVPMYSHRFVDESRALPELKGRPYAKDFFPEELWATLDGKDKGGPKGGAGGPKSSTVTAATATAAAAVNGQDKPRGTKRGRPVVGEDDDVDDPFGDLNDDEAAFQSLHGGRRKPETEEERKKRIAEAAGKAEENNNNEDGGGGGAEGVNLDDEEQELSQEDDDYEDDEDGGDYDAEQYFDDGADNEMEDDGGVGESAMDF